MMSAYDMSLFLKIVLIIVGFAVFFRSERMTLFLFLYIEKALDSYVSMLCSFFKFGFKLCGIVLIIYNLLWIYQPNLNWLQQYLAYK